MRAADAHRGRGNDDVFRWHSYLNMTYLALNLSRYVNGVAQEAMARSLRAMFARYRIDAITNGVHVATWTSRPFQALFDRHMPRLARRRTSACATR